jgi:hypothetical protein
MSYVDLVETMLVKKDDTKPTAARMKKTIQNTCLEDFMDTTNIPEEAPSSTTIILRPLCNTTNLSSYETEPMCAD